MSRNNFQGTFGDYDEYNTFNLEKKKWSELRKEFRILRKEAKQRIKALEKSEFSESKILQNKEYLLEDVSNMTKDELVRNIAYTASFLASDLSTLQGQESRAERVLEKFHDLGYHSLGREDLKPLFKFIDALEPYMNSKIMGSPEEIDLYQRAKESGVSIDKLTKSLTHFLSEQQKQMKDMPKDEFKQLHKYTYDELWNILSKRDMLNE